MFSQADSIGIHGSQVLASGNFQCVLGLLQADVQASSAVIRVQSVNEVLVEDVPSNDPNIIKTQAVVEIPVKWQQMGDGGESASMGTVLTLVERVVDTISDSYTYEFIHEDPSNPNPNLVDLGDCNGYEYFNYVQKN